MNEHGSAQAALEALPEVARAAGVENYEPCPVGVVKAELKAGAAIGARLIFMGAPDYPPLLADTSDAPPFLWAIGQGAHLLDRPMVALVGARNASSLGLRMAKALAGALSEQGHVVVSGLARGIDAAAHLASLDHGTVAVVAGGVDVMYPAENTKLAEDIAVTGLRLSEHPPGMVPQARHFPARNRIISGLVQAVVVVEAAAKSGSLITARTALDQGRDVLAVPGHPFDARAAGCNMLIRDGATLVRNADDVLAALPAPSQPAPSPQPELRLAPPPEKRSLAETARLHTDILSRLGPAPLAEDQLIRDLSAPAAQVSPALTDLEVTGKITRHPGGLVSRT